MDSPKGWSKSAGGSLGRSIPASRNIFASSRVVRTASTSGSPVVASSGLVTSNFLAVQGITETTKIFSAGIWFFSAYQFFITAPNISCGDLQLERLGNRSGKKCSQYLTQPGLQEVIRGNVPPLSKRVKSSVPSSIMVRSAAKSVSKTLSKPRRLRPSTSSPTKGVPGSRPNSSPMVVRIAGATCTTTCLSGSARARHTLAVLSFSDKAPVGQTSTHWPQRAQATSPSSSPKAGQTLESKPLPATPKAETS